MVSADMVGARDSADHSQAGIRDLQAEVLNLLLPAPLIAAFAIVMFVGDSNRVDMWTAPGVLALVSLATYQLRRADHALASAVLTLGAAIALTSLIWTYPGGLAALFLVLVVMGAGTLLSPGHSFLVAGLATGVILVAWRGEPGVLTEPVALVALTLAWSGTVLSWLSSRPLYTALAWSWHSYTVALRTVEELRDNQARLASLSKSLNEACDRLEAVNAELVIARRVAERARAAKAGFATSLSHELRAPLNLIVGFSEMMVMSPEAYDGETLPPAYRSDVEAIYRNAWHLSSLIDDVLDLGQIEADRMGLHKVRAGLAEIVDEAFAAIRSLFRDKGLTLSSDVPMTVPAVSVDRGRIRQVLINLLKNAARFTEAGGVHVWAEQREGETVVAVRDTGSGIAPEDAAHVFDEFWQAEQLDLPERRHEGSGLGLAISKRIVEAHGGNIGVESQVGRGTTFWFSLPSVEQVVSTPVASGRGQWANASLAGTGPIVAVIADDERAGSVVRRHLDSYRVIVAPTVSQARRLAEPASLAAIVLTDTTQRAACTQLQMSGQLPPRTPVITCLLRTPRRQAMELGIADYLVKPVDRSQLRGVLQRLGRGRRDLLLVDDDQDVLRMLGRMLRSISRRYTIREAHNGVECLERVRERRPDVVLLDLLMPELDGYQVIEELRGSKEWHDLLVVVVTAKDRSDETISGELQSISRAGGLSVGELMSCLRASLDALLAPPGTPPALPAASAA